MSKINITICRADGLPGFAAYLSGTLSQDGSSTIHLEPNRALVLLDVEAVFDDSRLAYEDGSDLEPRTSEDRKRHLIECLMHEFGHVLEEHFDTEFDEGWIERVVESYAK